ncbi:HEAT repeat domain-containing protein [Streptomyces sp. NPDC053755]|uniref:HEAT repeat domain-containing protein n=1 Tax=Streptomyces sp. NPDC053755 TaxID=3155815 RepID=UPI00343449C4
MSTPWEHTFDDALRRADVGRLSSRLDARLCPPAVLGRLIRHEEPRLRHLGLLLLDERLTAGVNGGDGFDGGAGQETAELARLLPTTLEGPPEVLLVLARLHARLGPHLRWSRRPSWRTAEMPERVRVAWLRADLVNDPTVIRREPPGELLYQAVQETTVHGAHNPQHLVQELVDSGDPVLQAAGLRLARQGLHAGLLAPSRVRRHLISLLAADGPEVVAAALAGLGEPWAALNPVPPGHLAPFLAAGPAAARPETADAALEAAARHGHRDPLWQVVEDPDLQPALRRRGMELLGDLADRVDIGRVTALAAQDPLLFGRPALACLRGLHRRGHFPGEQHVPSLIGAALADHTIPAYEVATVLFTCRRAMFRVLLDAPADDPSWPRRLVLLVALAGQGPADLPIGDAIERILPSAPRPEPFLRAIRELRHAPAEDAVLALLASSPTAALEALEAIGGDRTVAALREGLGLGVGLALAPVADEGASTGSVAGVIAPHLRAVRSSALELLWHLTEDPGQRRHLLVRLDPTDLPARIAADLGGPAEREPALLTTHLDPDEPVAALRRLAAHGGSGTLPVITDLLLRIVAEVAATREPGAAVAGPDDGRPAGEPVVPQEVLDALHGLGRHLRARGRIRPSCLLDAASAEEAGHALVATLALDLLDRPGLSDGEQAVLLEVLLRAPYTRTRARIHRFLRHRDRHVRKHAIALLARDATGDDAQALSASLIALVAARRDIQTVRQALLALGHAGARWAAPTIAACLGHPNMNVKKTAAEVLARAGTPAAVPALLFRLGHDDNPGLRRRLVESLRAILGEAYPAAVLAAAERPTLEVPARPEGPGRAERTRTARTERAERAERANGGHDSGERHAGRTRELLLEGLDRALSARSVLALEGQGSEVVPTLLALVAAGRVGLAAGTVEDLRPAMARHGVTLPAATGPAAHAGAARDLATLTAEGWHPAVALRLAGRDELPRPSHLRALRPMLPDWLRLAEAEPTARSRVLRLALRLCPLPWTSGELTSFARHTGVLLDGLAEASSPEDRHALLTALEAVAPTLTPFEKQTAADAVRALAPTPTGNRSTLTLLRALDAVLVRADLERALASAGLDADPRQAQTAVLREAFTPAHPPADGAAPARESRRWRAALDSAVRTTAALDAFRRLGPEDGTTPPSRERLHALIDAYASAGLDVRGALIDWMTALQPLDVPPWTLAETARVSPDAHSPTGAPRPRTAQDRDLDQPRSRVLRERLLAMLGSSAPDRRQAAALMLAEWPEPEAGLPVLRAYLHGDVEMPGNATPARLLGALDEAELRADGVRHDRVALLAADGSPETLARLVPLLLDWWEHDPPADRDAAGRALLALPADTLADRLRDRLDAGAWGFLDLLVDRHLLRTPALTRTRLRLRAEGRDDLADRLLLVEGPLRHPASARKEAVASAAPRARTATASATSATPSASTAGSPPAREALFHLARTGDPAQIGRALTRLCEEGGGPHTHRGQGPAPDEDPGLRELIGELLLHPRPGVRLRAHRASRTMLGRQTYLHHTSILLRDPEPSVVRMAIRTLCHAGWTPAIPAVAALLEHSHPAVRTAAAQGLADMGAPAVPALRHSAGRARPDKRNLYADVLAQITAAPNTTTDADERRRGSGHRPRGDRPLSAPSAPSLADD